MERTTGSPEMSRIDKTVSYEVESCYSNLNPYKYKNCSDLILWSLDNPQVVYLIMPCGVDIYEYWPLVLQHTVMARSLLCFQGIACNVESNGFLKLNEATKEVMGESNPYSITGSLPLVGDLQKAGFDVQVSGECSDQKYSCQGN